MAPDDDDDDEFGFTDDLRSFNDADICVLDSKPVVHSHPQRHHDTPPSVNCAQHRHDPAPSTRGLPSIVNSQLRKLPFVPTASERNAAHLPLYSKHRPAGAAAPHATAQLSDTPATTTSNGAPEPRNPHLSKLAKENPDAYAHILTLEGKLAIQQSRFDKVVRDNTSERDSLQQTIDRLSRERDAQKSLNEKGNQEIVFHQHDVRAEAVKPKQRSMLKGGIARGNADRRVPTTPRKNRMNGVGDGFDDDVVMKSPGQARDKSGNGTPKQTAKRKRSAADASPPGLVWLSERQSSRLPDDGLITVPSVRLEQDCEMSKILKLLIHNRPSGQPTRALDIFAKYAYPSSPWRSLSSIIFNGISLYRHEAGGFTLHFCRILLSLWDQCTKEAYYHPLHIIIATLRSVISHLPLDTTASLAAEVVPLAQSSTYLALDTSLAQPEFEQHLVLNDCLCLLGDVSSSCKNGPVGKAQLLWSLVSHNFIKHLLESPFLPTLSLTVNFLANSITTSGFGPIRSLSTLEPQTGRSSVVNESSVLLDCLTNLLGQGLPLVASSATPQPECELWSFRVDLLALFSSFLPSPAATEALAMHRFFLGRLITLIKDATMELCRTAPDTPLVAKLVYAIKMAVCITYRLVTDPPPTGLPVSLHQRLAAVSGARHAMTVAFSRLAQVEHDDTPDGEEDARGSSLSSPGMLEADINDDDVVNMARELLYLYLSRPTGK